MRLALVHDWLNQLGGAEDVLDHLLRLYPDAPLYTCIYDREKMPAHWQHHDIRTLWMDKLPDVYRKHQRYLPLYPLAWAGLDLSDYDVILSNKSGSCHGVSYGKKTLHICYCLAPTRYVWQFDTYAARENLAAPVRLAVKSQLPWMRSWDKKVAQRVHHFIAISTDIQQRIQTFYGRESEIIYPPVEVEERFKPAASHDSYFLSLGRLIPYKRVDLIVEACTRLNLPLKVGGTGRDRERLESLAGPTVEFLGYVPESDLPDLFARCRAFVFPGLEDFGITPVQAQAAGRPVIAYGAGGALDTVIPGKTGVLFYEQSVEALMNTLQNFDDGLFNPEEIRRHALRFDSRVFEQQITDLVARYATGQ
ncbi:MAG: glycosyltransferase [Anaerolineae bacterium]|nr:glycosyltransferase [Anaerolineae bacterium]